ncbi:hypothetical protein THAOC_21079 [Thalassiosira oceanica]|uniref:Uncharacterized protein n=1 Tax=Thalassiosira oceanica TaxID=159749 RepID=K0SJX3_THAOC|nr:hypothetical protein THAOC_21079 [Thalassiosira oceanica]|eukprot:EJK58772.1 hypothetical protein THAOC_21079 [Thalassiosira oceanica]
MWARNATNGAIHRRIAPAAYRGGICSSAFSRDGPVTSSRNECSPGPTRRRASHHVPAPRRRMMSSEPEIGETSLPPLGTDKYLGKILNSRVYDVAVETELQHAKNLSQVREATVTPPLPSYRGEENSNTLISPFRGLSSHLGKPSRRRGDSSLTTQSS